MKSRRVGIWFLLVKEVREWHCEKFLDILIENVELLPRETEVRREEVDWTSRSFEERNLTEYCLGNLMRTAQWGWLNMVDREDREDAIFLVWVCCGCRLWIGLRMATTKPASWLRRLTEGEKQTGRTTISWHIRFWYSIILNLN